ncbi:MAG: TrlF family AAA-like ATPase [Endozoicomonas sp.]|uniref:TrlF family AAA-like ATPase n=1 Tax=Endozoicomonas sp. TaxID=1892382 RepID=UPI003D9BFD59
MPEQYTKAQFWKCALQVNPFDYIRYRGQDIATDEDEYNQKLLAVCLEEKIKVLGIADHGRVESIEAIREKVEPHGIVVFPGFEVTANDKAHFVCLFSEQTSSRVLERYLGSLKLLDIKDGTRPSELSSTQLIEEVDKLGGFLFAAHCTNDNGVLKLKQNHIWTNPKLKAAQIPGKIEDLKPADNGFYYQVALNRIAQYKRDTPVALINAADIETPEKLREKSASCLIKMTRPCFQSFKQAFLDPESRLRLNHDVPENYASAIESIRFTNGYLDGVQVEPADHLNALIGGRGTGKSTLIESIRFAMAKEPAMVEAKKMHDKIIRENLSKEKAHVELRVRSAAMGGRLFTVSRRYGDRPVVKDEHGNISPHSPSELLPELEVLGQNEIYETARTVEGRDQLLSRFLQEKDSLENIRIQKILIKLKENRVSILKAMEQQGELEADVARLPKLEDQAGQFQSLGLEEKLKVIPRLEKEKQLAQRIEDEYSGLDEGLGVALDSLPDVQFLSDQALDGLPHKESLVFQRLLLEELGSDTRKLLEQAREKWSALFGKKETLKKGLSEQIRADEEALTKEFKRIPASQGKSGREIGELYQGILKEIERIRPKTLSLKHRKEQIRVLYEDRKSLLSELSEAQVQLSSNTTRSLRKLNKRLKGKLKIDLGVADDRQSLFDFVLSSNLEGVGAKRLEWLKEGRFSPKSLASTIRQGIDALKNSEWGITPTVASALVTLSEKQLLELEEVQLLDKKVIELNVAHEGQAEDYRHIDDLSVGQQCTAILHMLLLNNQDPLILDQPEDNLDNAFIADRIVAELRKAKLERQFIFATHNANIPVFGDAEWIGVLQINPEERRAEIPLELQGAIDVESVQKFAADILEGGKAAFNQRREKYGFN